MEGKKINGNGNNGDMCCYLKILKDDDVRNVDDSSDDVDQKSQTRGLGAMYRGHLCDGGP